VFAAKSLAEQEAECQLFVVARCAHRDRQRLAVDADLERLLNGDNVGAFVVLDGDVGMRHHDQ
jgi:hypothetical protein